jgi:energy-converting hydrogenase Eha subunit C
MKEEAKKIQDYLDITVSGDPAEIVDRIATLMGYMSRTGEMYAHAKKLLRARKTSEISKTILAIAKEQFLSATVQNALLDSICEEEAFMVDWFERINRSCTHQLDALRSLLSYEKEQMRFTP